MPTLKHAAARPAKADKRLSEALTDLPLPVAKAAQRKFRTLYRSNIGGVSRGDTHSTLGPVLDLVPNLTAEKKVKIEFTVRHHHLVCSLAVLTTPVSVPQQPAR